jgi:hypothetical protein
MIQGDEAVGNIGPAGGLVDIIGSGTAGENGRGDFAQHGKAITLIAGGQLAAAAQGQDAAVGFGDDVLRVSGSVGVGTVKPWNGKKAVHITEFDKRTQRIVAEGNLRTICEIEVEGWKYEGKTIDMTVRYTMYARHRDCQVTVLTSTDVDTLVTGVQKVKGGMLLEEPNLVGCWGTDWPVNDTVKYAKETVGLGVTLPLQKANLQKQDKANNLLFFSTKANTPFCFYITAVSMKEINSPISSAETFFTHLHQWQNAVAVPLIVNKNKPSNK